MLSDPSRLTHDLVRWIKLLDLPVWAKVGLACVLLLTLASALVVLVSGLIDRDRDAIAAGITVITVGLPIGLVMIAVVYGDGGLHRLKDLTHTVLSEDIPSALRENFSARAFEPADWIPEVRTRVSGCSAEYRIVTPGQADDRALLRFIVELNVQKVNVVFLLPTRQKLASASDYFSQSSMLQSCLNGARNEGYILNDNPEVSNGTTGLVLTKALHEDFLLDPARRLYFAQDLSFFIRGMIEAHRG